MMQRSTHKSASKNGRRLTERSKLRYSMDSDVRTIDNFHTQSLESSLYGLSIEDHGMPTRERFGSLDSFESSSSAFSLAPRTFNPTKSRSLPPTSHKTSGIILHPQTKGRPVVEFVFDDIPDQLMVPTLWGMTTNQPTDTRQRTISPPVSRTKQNQRRPKQGQWALTDIDNIEYSNLGKRIELPTHKRFLGT